MTTKPARTSRSRNRKQPLHKAPAPPLIIRSPLSLEEKLAIFDEIRKRDAEQPLEEALAEWEEFKKGIDEHRLPGCKLYENL